MTTATTFETSWKEWHQERERYYGDPLGWVSLTGLYWLSDEFETVADLPEALARGRRCGILEGIDGPNGWNPSRVHRTSRRRR